MVRKLSYLLLVILFLLSLSCASDTVISDDEMIKNFQDNQADFEKLRQMASEEPDMMRIAFDFTWLKANVASPEKKSERTLPKERWDEYRRLFNKLKLHNGIINYDSKEILFFATSPKNYVYTVEEPSPIVDSLDNPNFDRPEFNGNKPKVLYRKIKDNWYICWEVF